MVLYPQRVFRCERLRATLHRRKLLRHSHHDRVVLSKQEVVKRQGVQIVRGRHKDFQPLPELHL